MNPVPPSIPPPPEVDRVVDGRPGVLGEDGVGDLGGELDADDRLETGAVLEAPVEVERHPGPSVRGPEALDRDGVDRRIAPPEPPAERRARRVVVDDERRPAPSYDAGELAQPWLAPGTEEV